MVRTPCPNRKQTSIHSHLTVFPYGIPPLEVALAPNPCNCSIIEIRLKIWIGLNTKGEDVNSEEELTDTMTMGHAILEFTATTRRGHGAGPKHTGDGLRDSICQVTSPHRAQASCPTRPRRARPLLFVSGFVAKLQFLITFLYS